MTKLNLKLSQQFMMLTLIKKLKMYCIKRKKTVSQSLKFLTNNILSKKNKILNLEERNKKLEKKITQLNESNLSEIHKIFC